MSDSRIYNAALLERYLRLNEEDDDDEEHFILESLALMQHSALKRRRRFWIHPTIQRRQKLGEYHRLIKELESDDERFKQYFRMTKQQFYDILHLIENDIVKKMTTFRRPIGAAERLAITLK